MFITKKRYNEEKELLDHRIAEFEKTLHELYEEHLELRSKYNQLLMEKNNIQSQLDTFIQEMYLKNGDK